MVATDDQIKEVPNAQVSLVSQGKVIDVVKTDAAGSFSFANVNPGPYQIVGTANGMVGSQGLNVAPFAQSQPRTTNQVVLQHATPETAYNTFSSAPVSSFSSGPSFGYGGGGGYSGGGGGGSLLGGRLLGSPKGLLIIGGIAGGVVAISDNDSSPDQ